MRKLTLAIEPPQITHTKNAIREHDLRRYALSTCLDPQLARRKFFRPLVIHPTTRNNVRIARVLHHQAPDIQDSPVQGLGKISRTFPFPIDHISVISTIDKDIQHAGHSTARATLEFKPRLILGRDTPHAKIPLHAIARNLARPLIRLVPLSMNPQRRFDRCVIGQIAEIIFP